MHFSVFVHLNIESPIGQGIGVVVLMPEDVMRYPFNWALLSIALVAVIKSK
jgi:hypothetical protein